MKTIVLSAAAIMFGIKSAIAAPILPEVTTNVTMSNHDINRIVCPGKMNDLIFSKEKGLTAHFSGNSAFVKFKVQAQGKEYIYASEPCELFAVCDNKVYSLVIEPADIPSTTIRLSSPAGKKIKRNIRHFKNMPLEKRALQVIREAYKDSYPSGYEFDSASKEVAVSNQYKTMDLQRVSIDGVGLRLHKLQVNNSGQKKIRLREEDFLKTSIAPAILAIAVEDHVLAPGEQTRVFVVEQKEQP